MPALQALSLARTGSLAVLDGDECLGNGERESEFPMLAWLLCMRTTQERLNRWDGRLRSSQAAADLLRTVQGAVLDII